jgi:hypothetical protein
MYRVLDESTGNTVGIHVDGKLTKDDYGVLIPYFENLISECGPLNLLCDMTRFDGMEIEAFWEDFRFGIRHLGDFKRMAIVGDQSWLEWVTKVFNPLVKTDVKYFPTNEIKDAWTWVKS